MVTLASAWSRTVPPPAMGAIDSTRQLTTFPNRGRGVFTGAEALAWLVFAVFMNERSHIGLKP
jgi:hypothetical protein